MIEVYPNLYIGTWHDYETIVSGQPGWAIVHACKEYHRSAVGYKLWNVPRHHPEYLLARRENRLMLSLLDLPVSLFISKKMIDQTLDFIDQAYSGGLKVMVHCIAGRSRSPSITLLYLATRLQVLSTTSLEAAEEQFRRLYPGYHPSRGIREHLRSNWQQYCADGRRTKQPSGKN
jgi:dual specificity protein phosphatase-like protein